MISLIIPLYNKQESIASTIESVLIQSFKNFELILVNDGSTDKSLEVVSRFNDKKIRIFNKENGGVSSARNFGAKKAKFSWLFFLDADDVISIDCLGAFADMVRNYPTINFFTSNFYLRTNKGEDILFCNGKKMGVIQNSFKAIWNREIFPRTGSMLINKVQFDLAGGFRMECSMWEDLELILSLLKANKIVYHPVPFLTQHLEFNTLSQKRQPLEKEFAYYVDLSKASNFYHKLILLELLLSVKKKKLKDNNQEAVKFIEKKIGYRTILVFLGRVERYILKVFKYFQFKSNL